MDVFYLTQDHIKEKFIEVQNPEDLENGLLGGNDTTLCKTCHNEECLGHMGYVTLRREIPHPLMVERIYSKLLKYCWNCKKLAKSSLELLPDKRISLDPESIFKLYSPICSHCDKPLSYSSVSWNQEIFVFEKRSKLKEIQKLKIKELDDECRSLTLRYFPVMPVHLDKEGTGAHSLLSKYKRFFSANMNQYLVCKSIIGISEDSRKGYSIIGEARGKSGMVEQEVLGKRLIYSGRSVITPDPSLDIDQIILPKSFMRTLELRSNDLVLLNRQPTLRKNSVLALMVVETDNEDIKTIRFNPCLCESFNADFDGDEMNIFKVPTTHKSYNDALRMMPSVNTHLEDSGPIIIYPHQECIYGASLLGINVKEHLKNYSKENISSEIKKIQDESYKKLEEDCLSLTNFRETIKNIIDSGARGTPINYSQMFDKVGSQEISEDTKVDKKVFINSSFEDGLSFDEMFTHCQSSREAIISIGVNTPNVGYMEKKMISLLNDLVYKPDIRFNVQGNKIVSKEVF